MNFDKVDKSAYRKRGSSNLWRKKHPADKEVSSWGDPDVTEVAHFCKNVTFWI